MNLELEARLRAFAALVRKGSFSGAADELFVSQPAVSKHISELEKAVGHVLVVRHNKGCSLTPAGEYLARSVLRAEAILSETVRGLEAYAGQVFGTLTIAASGTPGTYLLPRVIAAFHQDYPHVEIVTRFGTSAQIVDDIRSHRAEVGIVGGLTSAPELKVVQWVEDDIVLIGPPALSGRVLEGSELRGLTWISREEGSSTRQAMQAGWHDLGISPQTWLALPSWEAVKLAVAGGAGIAACSRFALDVELAAGTLCILDAPRWRMKRHISIVQLEGTLPTFAAERFLDVMYQSYGTKQ